jgi:hypothetical protein
MMNHKNTFADITGMPVTYAGENHIGQFMACNGAMLVTDIFATPQEMVERFGKRIRTFDAEMKYSGSYAAGLTDSAAGKPYAPTRSHGRQAVLEYGTGYLRGLIEKAPVVPKAKDTLTEAEHNAMMDKAEGRAK